MNVLILHNRYRSRGGEERSVEEIKNLLTRRGHTVSLLQRDSEQLSGVRGKLQAGASLLAGGFSPQKVLAAAEAHRADVIHAHNILPLFGSRAISTLSSAGFPVVQHLHNYKLFCPASIAFQGGQICHRCHGRNTTPAVRFNCRDSLFESSAYATALALHTKTTVNGTARFITPSNAARELLESFGLPTGRTDVLLNFLTPEWFAQESTADQGSYGLFVGRLTKEKGADIAIRIAAAVKLPLVIAGTGPQQTELAQLANELGADCKFYGQIDTAELREVRKGAALALAPSRWEEPCPYSVIESLAAGLPVLTSNLGGLPELVGDDASISLTDTDTWKEKVGQLWSSAEMRKQQGEAALNRAQTLFNEDIFYQRLISVYEGQPI